MDFGQLITDYKESDNNVSSPLWIWFDKKENNAKCKICKTDIPQKSGSTGGLIHHLQRHHNFISKYNAWKIFEELSAIKDKRLQNRKRKNEASEDD